MANNEGEPVHSDRGAWNTDDFASEHAKDISDSTYKHHLPTPSVAGRMAVDDGDEWNAVELSGDLEIDENGVVTITGELQPRIYANVEIPVQALGLSPTTAPDLVFDTNDRMPGYSYDISDESGISFRIPDKWDGISDFEAFVEWYIDEARTGSNEAVKWQIEWAAVPKDESEDVNAPTDTGTLDSGDATIPTSARYPTETSIGRIYKYEVERGDRVGCNFSRITETGNPPTADPVVVGLRFEYISDRQGELVDWQSGKATLAASATIGAVGSGTFGSKATLAASAAVAAAGRTIPTATLAASASLSAAGTVT